MSIDKKFGLGFLFICGMIVSGCFGYSLKTENERQKIEIIESYRSQEDSCHRMIADLKTYAEKNIDRKITPKELAIIRMQRD